MIDAGHEIEMLRNRLIMSGLSHGDANNICSMASNDIHDAVVDIVTASLKEAVHSSEDVATHKARSHKFIQEVMATRDGSLFKISTESGLTDFSEPPFPMLPKLLSNAKVSSEGHRYKVIPMRKSVDEGLPSKTIENAIKNINKQRQALKAEKDKRNENESRPDPLSHIGDIKASSDSSEYDSGNTGRLNATTFRTASDKQDANNLWVRPAKKADMTESLSRINESMQDQIDQAIASIIAKYRGAA